MCDERKIITLQEQDPSLTKYVKEAGQNQKVGRSEVYFNMKDRIYYMYCRNFEGREISQVVIPKGLRETVLMLAHDAVMSGHQRQKKTKDRILREFWWPATPARNSYLHNRVSEISNRVIRSAFIQMCCLTFFIQFSQFFASCYFFLITAHSYDTLFQPITLIGNTGVNILNAYRSRIIS